MAPKHHAEIPEIVSRQLWQRVPIDFVVAERRCIALKAQTLQPRRYVHAKVPRLRGVAAPRVTGYSSSPGRANAGAETSMSSVANCGAGMTAFKARASHSRQIRKSFFHPVRRGCSRRREGRLWGIFGRSPRDQPPAVERRFRPLASSRPGPQGFDPKAAVPVCALGDRCCVLDGARGRVVLCYVVRAVVAA